MILLRFAGYTDIATPDLKVLREKTFLFLKLGGTLTASEILSLTELERVILEEQQDKFRAFLVAQRELYSRMPPDTFFKVLSEDMLFSKRDYILEVLRYG